MKNNTHNRQRRMRLQLVLATMLAVAGLALIVASFLVPPVGVIDNSVLVAIGEVFTFSGSLVGIDVKYKTNQQQQN